MHLAGVKNFKVREIEVFLIKPKPMVEIGGLPLLWHILKIYSNAGINEFIICLGYKGYVIKEFFLNYHRHVSDISIDLYSGESSVVNSRSEDWKITLVDTGLQTMTGGRLKKIAHLLEDEDFCMTYGDGLADIDVKKEIDFHNSHKKLATVCAVQPPGRFGVLEIDKGFSVQKFQEKPTDEFGWINGGFFVLNPSALDHIADDNTSWEEEPLRKLSSAGELAAYKHYGFWQPCDTLRDKRILEGLWDNNKAPWKIWND